MNIQAEILQAIKTIVKEYASNAPSDVLAVVLEIKNKEYRVTLGGADRWIKNGIGLEFNVGDRVWVRIPNGNIGQAFIEAKGG